MVQLLEGHKRPEITAEAGISERQGTCLGLGRISTCGEQEPQVGVRLVKNSAEKAGSQQEPGKARKAAREECNEHGSLFLV